MKILSVNAGSSSLKFTMFELPAGNVLISGNFEKIGIGNSFYSIKLDGEKIVKEKDLKDHSIAVSTLIEELIDNKIVNSLDDIDGIGHRVVHGGPNFKESVLINNAFLEEFKNCIEYAPLHNPAHLMGINAFMEALPNTPQVVVFDTAFHQSMDEEMYLYPLPYEWNEKYHIRRYGAHGTSHRFINKTISEKLDRNDLKVISCHIGNGSSLCAINAGKVVHTSMGFTPLAGTMMGTRSGDVDASIIPFIVQKENKTCEDVLNDLNKKSGLLGVSGVSSDFREVQNGINEGNHRCKLAFKMLCQSIANYIAMYNNMLDGSDVIVFTAGIGENSVTMRRQVIENIKSLGVTIDEEANGKRGEFVLISGKDSKIPVYVLPTNEELMIATDTYNIIK